MKSIYDLKYYSFYGEILYYFYLIHKMKIYINFVLHPDDSWVLKFYIFFAKLGVIKKTIWTLLSNHCISLPSDMANIFLIHTLKLYFIIYLQTRKITRVATNSYGLSFLLNNQQLEIIFIFVENKHFATNDWLCGRCAKDTIIVKHTFWT